MRASRKLLTLAAALVCLLAAASCAGDEPQVHSAQEPSDGTGNSSSRLSPRVEAPIDPTPFVANPCQLVPESKLAALGRVNPPEPDVDSNAAKKLLGPGCTWLAADTGEPTIGIRIHTLQVEHAEEGFEGLEGIYQAKQSGKIDHLQPLQLAGHPDYPAVVYGQAAEINAGTCAVSVGIADDLTYSVQTIQEEDPKNACTISQRVAEIALESMLSGGK